MKPMPDVIRVVVIDDHLVTRKGIISLIEKNPRIQIVAEGSAGNHVLELLAAHQPDVLITDLQMPAYADGPKNVLFEPVSTLQKAIQQYRNTTVFVLSQEHNVHTIQSLAAVGVKGYMLKTDDFAATLDQAVEMIRLGAGASYFSSEVWAILLAAPRLKVNTELSERHLEVIRAIFRSPEATRKQLAESLNIAQSTLQKHINSIFEEMGVPNMESCLIKAMRMRIVDVEAVLGQGNRS
jgi:DNA-binding NarL/FixJ family response regulator